MSGDLRMPELTVGLIGCGSIARSAHVPALLRASALVRVLSVCDIRPAVAEQVAHTLGAGWTSDYHQLLEDPRIAGPGVPQSGWQPDPDKATTWYVQARYAAGTAFPIGVHEMDLLRWFAGSEAQSISMESKMVDPQQEVPDTVTIQIRFENQVLGACDIFTHAPAGYPIHHELEVFGTRGMLRSRDRVLRNRATGHVAAERRMTGGS